MRYYEFFAMDNEYRMILSMIFDRECKITKYNTLYNKMELLGAYMSPLDREMLFSLVEYFRGNKLGIYVQIMVAGITFDNSIYNESEYLLIERLYA